MYSENFEKFNDTAYYLDFALGGCNMGYKDNFMITDGNQMVGTTCSGVSIF
jgi:hypothetical protein